MIFLLSKNYYFFKSKNMLLKSLRNRIPLRTNSLNSTFCRTFSTVPPSYDVVYKKSIEHPEEFWSEVAKGIEWFKPFHTVLDNSNPPFTKWFVGGSLNTSYNALDRHIINGKGSQNAVIYDSPITGKITKIIYNELKERVAKLAGALASLGVKKGDIVVIYMPMIPDIIVGMLAVARLGAIHNVVFGGFSAQELSVRVAHSKAKVILCANVGIEPSRVIDYKPIVDEAISLSSHKPKHCVVLQREDFKRAALIPERDLDWHEIEAKAVQHDPVPVNSEDPVYILYTSGTTGAPKGIVRPTGGHSVVLPWTMKALYGLNPEDVWWAASDFGWVVGHSYICYAPLFNGNTTIIYEGKPVGTPDSQQFFRVIKEHDVKAMFVAPTALRSIAREVSQDNCLLSDTAFRHLFVAGEVLDHKTRIWSEKVFGSPVLDHWWQTETGFAITAHCMGLNMNKNPPRGATGKPFMGFNVKVLNENGNEVQPGELGRIVCKLPLPPGNFSTLFEADQRYRETYFTKFPGYYDTMDAGILDKQGYVSVQARDDDVINVAGHRLSTIALEEALLAHEDVIDAAVIGVTDELKGEIPCGLFVKKNQSTKSDETLMREVIEIVRKRIGPVAAFRLCTIVEDIPKTRSGKIPRKSFADIAKGINIKVSPTIEDPSHYKHVVKGLQKLGFANNVTYPFH